MGQPASARVFASDTLDVKVVGASQYQDAIREIVGEPTGRGDRPRWAGQAVLRPEPDNPHDPCAVQVVVEGRPVGYLARDLAERLQPAIQAIAERQRAEVVVACHATGGFRLPDGGRASIGLVLDFDPEELLRAA